jgi:hypothetical protein
VLATHGQDYILEATGSGNTTDGTRAFRILKGTDERLRITSAGDLEPAGDIKLTKSPDPRIYANTSVGLNIDGMALYLNRYVNSSVVTNLGGGNMGVGVIPSYSGVFGGSQRVLHIGGTAAPGLRIQSSTTNQGDFIIQAGNSGGATYLSNLSNNAATAFFNTSGGSTTEKLRINHDGGITFNGDTATANALDDYEEGTWTPTCASVSSVSYTNQYGRYTKVGNCITIWWDLIWSSLSGGNNGRIGGLPYTPVVNTNQGGYGVPVFRDASGTNSENRIYGNSSYFSGSGIMLQHYNSSGNPTSGSFNGSGRITGWAQYFDNNAY